MNKNRVWASGVGLVLACMIPFYASAGPGDFDFACDGGPNATIALLLVHNNTDSPLSVENPIPLTPGLAAGGIVPANVEPGVMSSNFSSFSGLPITFIDTNSPHDPIPPHKYGAVILCGMEGYEDHHDKERISAGVHIGNYMLWVDTGGHIDNSSYGDGRVDSRPSILDQYMASAPVTKILQVTTASITSPEYRCEPEDTGGHSDYFTSTYHFYVFGNPTSKITIKADQISKCSCRWNSGSSDNSFHGCSVAATFEINEPMAKLPVEP